MKNQKDNYPNQWLCPISQQLMKDPVIAEDGFSYEKREIQNWFKTSNLSPITGLHLVSTKLIPNRALKNTIEQFLNQNMQIQNHQNNASQKVKQNCVNQDQIFNKNIEIKNKVQDIIELKTQSIFDDEQQDYILNLRLIPPQNKETQNRKPISLVCILDTSESMNIDAVKDSKDNESHGFSRLDLVKHSINTLIQFMNDKDELTLIIFNTGAQCILQTTKMNNAGKKMALKRVQNLQGQGTTNIWQGLRLSLQVLKKINHKDKNVFTILLTDGEPNLNPPRGIVPTLKKYIQIQELDTPNFHVFGYGYELDVKLMQDIARKGAGTFAYIPDCSMVGTVFINFMANCLSTMTNKCIMEIHWPEGSKNLKIQGYETFKPNQYNLGCIQYGQQRDILIKIPKGLLKQGQIKVFLKYGFEKQQENIIQISSDLQLIRADDDKNIRIRFKYLELLKKCINHGQKFQLSLHQIHLFYYALQKQEQNEFIEALLKELKCDNDENFGQVQKAFLRQQWYKKWGKIYIPSLLLAHQMQVCTNFKDPLLQLYGGQLFSKYQNKMDTIFIKMAPPKPSAKKQKNIVYKPAPVNMSSYYRNYGGCIDGQCFVTLWKLNAKNEYQTYKQKLKNVKKSDLVGQKRVKIQCLVQTRVFSFVEMVKIGSLVITPWHPIFYNGQWTFPINIRQAEQIYVEKYYNFVTEGNKALEIQEIQCISLGHNLLNNPITYHDYLSTQRVMRDLKSNQQNYSKGLVVIRSVQRNPLNNQISKFIVS